MSSKLTKDIRLAAIIHQTGLNHMLISFFSKRKRFSLSEDQQMTVERGDLLGVHYPSGQSDGVLSVNDLEAEPTTAQNRATTGTLRYR